MYWDFRWDWGLLIGTRKDTRFLRDQMIFSKNFYYTCMLLNTIFRFWWVTAIFTVKFAGGAYFMDSLGVLTFIAAIVEAIRRTFWAVIRVENEFFNNFE